MSAPAPARIAAANVLERVTRDLAFADLALDAELARRPLDQRDVALATEVVYGSLRWQRYLDWILAPHSKRPLDAVARSLLDARDDLTLDPPSCFPIALGADGFFRSLPHVHGTDGFTAARIRRAV